RAAIPAATTGTDPASGPMWSRAGESGWHPATLTRPRVGLSPTTPHSAAGIRIEPEVSVPRVRAALPSATAVADPLLEPPGIAPGTTGLTGMPQSLLLPVAP